MQASVLRGARGLADGQEYRGGALEPNSRLGRSFCPTRNNQVRQNKKAMLNVTAEQIGQVKLPTQPLTDWSV